MGLGSWEFRKSGGLGNKDYIVLSQQDFQCQGTELLSRHKVVETYDGLLQILLVAFSWYTDLPVYWFCRM